MNDFVQAEAESRSVAIDELREQIACVESAPPAQDTVESDDREYARAKKRALNMLAARDHSRTELHDKLVAKEHPESVVSALIDKLERSGLLNDAAFAQSYVRSHRDRRALSKSALRRELKKRGIDDELVAETLEPVVDEHEVAFGVAMKKARSTVGLPRETRERRILGMLARRGFPSSVCVDVTRRALDEN